MEDETDRCRASERRRFICNAGMVGLSAAAIASGSREATAGATRKGAKYFGVPWEAAYGYAQAVKSGDLIFVSGQLSHDETGNFIAPAPLDNSGKVVDFSNMEAQMRQSYKNAQAILGKFGASLANVVEEVIYVLDMKSAFAAAGPVRKAAYGTEKPEVASTILVTPSLALPQQLIEIKLVARL
jgi:enamine deaminase RidA (YjgF/YER057c/UK114 family)